MNILFCLPRQHPNQASWYHALTRVGHTVQYMVSYSLPINERGDLPSPTVISTTILPTLYSLFTRVYSWLTGQEIQKPYLLWPDHDMVEKTIVEFAPDLIIIREALTPLSLITQRVARKRGIPTIHYTQAPLQKPDGLASKTLRWSGVIPGKRMSPTLDPHSKGRVLGSGFYVPLFVPAAISEAEISTPDTIRILFIGKYIPRKNHILLLRAFAEILKDNPATLTLVGSTIFANETYREDVKKTIAELGLSTNVRQLSDVDPLEMGPLYKAHDVFVLPSVDEPFSISPLEALAYGVPVVVTDSNGCQFHIESGQNGYVVKSNDFESLVASLRHIVDRTKLDILKKNALAYARDVNNEENFLEHFTAMATAVTTNHNQ